MNDIPFYISHSTATTVSNRTGAWRFLRPDFADKTAPCRAACPAGEDIARIEMMAAQGDDRGALEALLGENPFPAVCGRVCFHPCETACNRGGFDAAVGIHLLERYLGDRGIADPAAVLPAVRPATGRRIAVAGAGPAGLSAAYFLARLGYGCDLFEAAPAPGGILRWGIPAYRLPEPVLSAEIARIQRMGVRIRCNAPMTPSSAAEWEKRYQAIFVGCGQGIPLKLNIPGGGMAADGMAFLNRCRRGSPPVRTGTAAVIGGGNTAVDVARSLVRCGAAVTIVYRRRREDMPAFAPEIEAALGEGVRLKTLAAPVRIDAETGGLRLTLQPMRPDPSHSGSRARVVPDGSRTESLRVDAVYTAVGAEAEAAFRPPAAADGDPLRLSHCVVTLSDPPVVFGGDLTNRFRSVPDAVASGKQAAMALDTLFTHGADAVAAMIASVRIGPGPALSMAAYLGSEPRVHRDHVVGFEAINTAYFEPAERVSLTGEASLGHSADFTETLFTLPAGAARREARRCFNCGVCNGCDNCRLFCPEVAVVCESSLRRIDEQYCKGCGICVTECPRNAMVLTEESR